MKKLLILLMAAMFLVACGSDDDITKEERKGLSAELQEDASEIAEIIRDLYVDQGLSYEELDIDSDEYKSIHEFDHDSYKNEDEEYSKQESSLNITVERLISNYILHGSETEKGTTRDRGDDVIDMIQCIEKNTGGEGFYPC